MDYRWQTKLGGFNVAYQSSGYEDIPTVYNAVEYPGSVVQCSALLSVSFAEMKCRWENCFHCVTHTLYVYSVGVGVATSVPRISPHARRCDDYDEPTNTCVNSRTYIHTYANRPGLHCILPFQIPSRIHTHKRNVYVIIRFYLYLILMTSSHGLIKIILLPPANCFRERNMLPNPGYSCRDNAFYF